MNRILYYYLTCSVIHNTKEIQISFKIKLNLDNIDETNEVPMGRKLPPACGIGIHGMVPEQTDPASQQRLLAWHAWGRTRPLKL